jgi:hypothetical protein
MQDYEDDEIDHSDGCPIEKEDILCCKCGKVIDLPLKDGPYEYYETGSNLHGQLCPECNRPFCD